MYFPCNSLYNRDLLKQGLSALAKGLLIVTGVGVGVFKALEVLGPPREAAEPARKPENNVRLDSLEERLTRLETSLESLKSAPRPEPAPATAHFVTKAEMNAALEQLSGTLDSDIERRFDIQNRSVQSLRTMVARTDELLEQVLESIESSGIPA